MAVVQPNFNQTAVHELRLALVSGAATTGLFDAGVAGHEPKSPPGNGSSYAVWLGPITPVPALSDLVATAGRVTFYGQVYIPFMNRPEDKVEDILASAVLGMVAVYSAGFTIGGTVYAIDLQGISGQMLTTDDVGYTEMSGTHYRTARITIPVLITDLWSQEQ